MLLPLPIASMTTSNLVFEFLNWVSTTTIIEAFLFYPYEEDVPPNEIDGVGVGLCESTNGGSKEHLLLTHEMQAPPRYTPYHHSNPP
ncbi:unnamed protein product, partial [Sphenostylis stenocarpa]